MTLLREPLVHFLLIGAGIYLLYGLFAEPANEIPDQTITISRGEIQWMETSWKKRWNRLPTPEEREGLIQQYIKETVLYREALAMGLDQNDTIIRRRLAQKLEFLSEDLLSMTPPTDQELQTFFAQHRTQYEEPIRYTFTQVFLDPDKRGDQILSDAEGLKTKLEAQAYDPHTLPSFGDVLMLPNDHTKQSQTDIQKIVWT